MFYGVTTSRNGSLVNAKGDRAASLHSCLGKTPQPDVVSFAGEAQLGNRPFTGMGRCTRLKTDFPEPGVTIWTCYLQLTGLPGAYAGGLLTTNTVTTRASIGEVSDPPGYLQPSVATIRLWRKR